MTHLQNYLKVTWPSFTLSAAITAGGVALVKEAATKTKGVALTLLGTYVLMNHIAFYFYASSSQLKNTSESINNQSFKERTIQLVTISTVILPAVIAECLGF